MNENNKKFLNKLYDDMVINNIISNNVVSDRDSKIKIVNDYINRISNIENKVLNYKESLRVLKLLYYNKYIRGNNSDRFDISLWRRGVTTST